MARTNIKLFCGNSNPALALDVAKMLDVELSDVTVSGGFWRRVIFVCYYYLFPVVYGDERSFCYTCCAISKGAAHYTSPCTYGHF